MMPLDRVRRIHRRFIYQTAWTVHSRNSITAILHKPGRIGHEGISPRVNSRIEGRGWVAKSKWPILLPAYPLEKSAPGFVDAGIHSL
jgi:hypothetical protein